MGELKFILLFLIFLLALPLAFYVLFTFVPKVFRLLFRNVLGLHTWSYRNPFDRTCTVCKRHEVNHCMAGGNIWTKPGWWEVFNDGDMNANPCGKPPKE